MQTCICLHSHLPGGVPTFQNLVPQDLGQPACHLQLRALLGDCCVGSPWPHKMAGMQAATSPAVLSGTWVLDRGPVLGSLQHSSALQPLLKPASRGLCRWGGEKGHAQESSGVRLQPHGDLRHMRSPLPARGPGPPGTLGTQSVARPGPWGRCRPLHAVETPLA